MASGHELEALPGEGTATIHVPSSAAMYQAGIEGLTEMNEALLQTFRFPPLYDSGAVYRKEENDTWRHALDVYRAGWGDCEDLAAWRAAELRVSGEDPEAFVYVYRSGAKRFHAVVGHGDGTVEDPSYILGMKVPRGWRPIEFVGQTRIRRQAS